MELEITKITSEYESVDLRSSIDFANLLNNVLNNIKMCHWYAVDYNLHIITGNLYENLSDKFDELQEQIIGVIKSNSVMFPIFNVSQGVENMPEGYEHIERLLFYTKLLSSVLSSLAMKHFVEDCGPNGINNTIEEILSSINKSLYLIGMLNLD